jgi:hypothetical protein
MGFAMSHKKPVLICLWSGLFVLFVAACNTFDLDLERTSTPGSGAGVGGPVLTRVIETRTPVRDRTEPWPTPTSVLDGSHLTYTDPALGLAFDIPLWWKTRASPGTMAGFVQQNSNGVQRTVLALSVLNPESNSLDSALAEVTRGAWGPHIVSVEPVPLGTFEALRVHLHPGADRPPVAWLLVAPSGRALSIISGVDPASIEPLIQPVLDTLHAVEVVTPRVEPVRTVTPLPTPWATVTPPAAFTPEPVGTVTDVEEPAAIDGESKKRPPLGILPGIPTTLAEETGAGTPYCRPREAAVELSASATTLAVGQAVSVTVTLTNGEESGVQPQAALNLETLEPVEHRISLQPGGSDAAQFVLHAVAPGRMTLTGSTSFEMHALDFSWGSWSGCESSPLTIVVGP